MKPSAAYLAALEASKEIHKGKSFTGKFLRPHAPFIKEIIDRLECKTVLDYGCGKGLQYEWVMPKHGTTLEQWWGVEVTKYDPAYPPFATEPVGKFDLVICTHTLGAIPEFDLPWVIGRLFSLARKAIYISERCGAARKQLGDNALRPSDWTPEQWQKALGCASDVELTLATRHIDAQGGKITSHRRFSGWEWSPVTWPEGVRGLNHTWA